MSPGAGPAPHIVLCTEADATVGLGHAVRCAGLLGALTVPHRLTVIGGGPLLRALFPHADHRPAPVWTELDWLALGVPSADLVVADIPFYRRRDWRRLRCPGAALLAIDDHGGDVVADVVINGTVLPAYQHYDAARVGRVLAGPAHALLRPAFGATRWQGEGSGAVLVIAGSGAEARDWALAQVRALVPASGSAAGSSLAERWSARRVDLVVGRAFDAMQPLRELCAAAGVHLHTGLDAEALARLLAGAAVALLTAGMVLYEAVATGVPTVAYPQIDDLVGEAAWFAARGACIDLGPAQGTPAAAAAAVRHLITDSAAARAMSARQQALLDGRGMARAAAVVQQLLAARQRPVQPFLETSA